MPTPKQCIVAFLLCLSLTSCQATPSVSEKSLAVAYAQPVTNFSPLGLEAKDRRVLLNVYEPLIAFDRSFNLKTALAVSWGRVNEYTWEFRLREGVQFHNGNPMDIHDVLHSLKMAKESEELGDLFEGISLISEEEGRLRIHTERPDPLLLNKLTNVLIFPDELEDFSIPVGTGPFQISDYSNDVLRMDRFDSYWGVIPYYAVFEVHNIQEPAARLAALLEGRVQILGDVPPQYVASLKEENFELVDFPGLELSFLMLNAERFQDEALRSAVWHSVPTDLAELLGGGFLMPSSQYAATGIFGFDPALEARIQGTELALDSRAALEEVDEIVLDLPIGLEVLGRVLAENFATADLDLKVNMMELVDYEQKIMSGESEMYFFGWKYDLPDVADFFESVLAADGSFNGIQFESESFEALLESASHELNLEERKRILGLATQELLSDRLVIPLFEAKRLFVFDPALHWEPRLDGFILASEIFENMLE